MAEDEEYNFFNFSEIDCETDCHQLRCCGRMKKTHRKETAIFSLFDTNEEESDSWKFHEGRERQLWRLYVPWVRFRFRFTVGFSLMFLVRLRVWFKGFFRVMFRSLQGNVQGPAGCLGLG